MHGAAPHEAGDTRSLARHIRRGALAAAAIALVAGTGAAVTTSASGAPARKATLTVTKLTGVPGTTVAGATVKATASVRNASKAKPGKKTVVFHLSSDAKLDRKDVRLAASGTGKVRPKATKTVSASLRLPASLTPGTYYVLACVDGPRCKAAKTVVGSSGPTVPDRGTLTGTLKFLRLAPFEPGSTVDMHAEVTVAMSYAGPVTKPDELQSTGSTYSYTRNTRKEVTAGPCTTTDEENGGGTGTLAEVANPYDDEIFGGVSLNDLSEISLTTVLRYNHGKVVTRKGDDTCDPGVDRGPVSAARHTTEMTLSEVSRTATDITYRVSKWNDSDSVRSAWERIDGTLTLHLG